MQKQECALGSKAAAVGMNSSIFLLFVLVFNHRLPSAPFASSLALFVWFSKLWVYIMPVVCNHIVCRSARFTFVILVLALGVCVRSFACGGKVLVGAVVVFLQHMFAQISFRKTVDQYS